ncbi:MAG TPA: S8 family peptidase, partial [Polyangiaceae bacterium]
MAIPIPRSLVEFILLGPKDDRRQLQDSPLLGDVWVQFASKPDQALELLITPHKNHAAGEVASKLAESDTEGEANIAYLQGIVAASLTFQQVIHLVVPITHWWWEKRIRKAVEQYANEPESLTQDIRNVLQAVKDSLDGNGNKAIQDLESTKRFVALAGLILWANHVVPDRKYQPELGDQQQIAWILNQNVASFAAAALTELVDAPTIPTEGESQSKGLVYAISRNRDASPAIARSVSAVKGDAATKLFTVSCKDIVWAVIDSGIDARHPAFAMPGQQKTRIKRSFDFTCIRDLVSLANLNSEKHRSQCLDTLGQLRRKKPLDRPEARERLMKVAATAKESRIIDWPSIESLVELDSTDEASRPSTNHGTHVAGSIGANKEAADAVEPSSDSANGMCPDITIWDFRVLAPTLDATEFAVIAALQYIRHLNERSSVLMVHGANLSLSIPHDVRNYACGRTPVCDECERLVNSGVVVVAAAGNRGYQNFETKDGLYEGYAAFSITDPGNADGVITVGATHRFWPHTYGVSFFSSRGPTGDGRIKPDLVAPGERICATLPDNAWGDLDGTSMAAPHVSGAAAMLMARYSELIGQPRRIKEILCKSATDLGRERSFQGHGML